jgi:uncharacterized protein with PIN domain
MHVELRFYAQLNFFIAHAKQQKTFTLELFHPASIKDLIESQGVPHTEIGFLLANGQSVGFDYLLADSDRISVFPDFHTLPVSEISKMNHGFPGEPKFILDGHLGKLASYLRLLGFDTLYPNQADDEELARLAASDRRILLSRDRGLLKRKSVIFGGYVRNTDPQKQIAEVFHRYNLADYLHPFTRCAICNGILIEVLKSSVQADLPQHTRDSIERVWQCVICKKMYWRGSHMAGIERLFTEISTLISITPSKTKKVAN